MSKKILFVMRAAPYGTSLAREALESVLAAGSFEQQASVLFIDDGVLQIVKDQAPSGHGVKNHCSMLKALPIYDIERLFADKHSLTTRNLSTEQIIEGVTTIDSNEIQTLMTEHDHILSF